MSLLANLLALLCTFSGVVSVCSSIPSYKRIRSLSAPISETGSWIVVMNFFLLVNVVYGISIKNVTVVISSAVGVISTQYSIITLHNLGQDRQLMDIVIMVFYILFLFLAAVWGLFLNYSLIPLSILSVTMNLGTSSFLFQPLIKTFKTGVNYNPPVFTVFNVVNAFMWTLYGLLINDFVLWFPSLVSALIRCLQVIQVVFYRKTSASFATNQEEASAEVQGTPLEDIIVELHSKSFSLSSVERNLSALNLAHQDVAEVALR
ncbi:hypothetical protein RCL1_001915 [Eukaryota sp. TZLM3-RCL]